LFIGKKLNVPGQRDLSYAALIVLKAIGDFPTGGYGYNLMQALTKKYDWAVKSGTVYPILKRLLEKKFVIQKEGESRKKVYYITPLGHELLKSLETELKIIEARSSPEGWNSDVIIEKLRAYCVVISNNAKTSEEINLTRRELRSIKDQITNIIDLIDEHLGTFT
jgi:DNA-binding PadR family transcriptional regulator